MLESLLKKVFFAEQYFGQLSGNLMNLDQVYNLFLDFAISLIILKFLKKGFDIYIGWQDGDKDSDPTNLVMNFIRAIITAISFRYFYTILVDIVSDFSDKALSSLLGMESSSDIIAAILNVVNGVSNSLFWVIAALILIICYCILWLKFLVLGVEMLMLRIAFPLACIGLIDSDKGMFTPYLKKIFTICITAVIQIFLLRMSIVLSGAGHIVWGIALAMGAMKTPKSLQEFMFSYGGGGNPISSAAGSVYHIKQLIKKLPKPTG